MMNKQFEAHVRKGMVAVFERMIEQEAAEIDARIVGLRAQVDQLAAGQRDSTITRAWWSW